VLIQLDEAEILTRQKKFDEAASLGEDAVAKTVAMFGFVSDKARSALHRVHAMFLEAGYEGRTITVIVPDDEVMRAQDSGKRVGETRLRKGQLIEVGAKREESGLTLQFNLEKDQVPDFSKQSERSPQSETESLG
jgi:hypothetical protein